MLSRSKSVAWGVERADIMSVKPSVEQSTAETLYIRHFGGVASVVSVEAKLKREAFFRAAFQKILGASFIPLWKTLE